MLGYSIQNTVICVPFLYNIIVLYSLNKTFCAYRQGEMVFVIALVWWDCPAGEVKGSLVGAYRAKTPSSSYSRVKIGEIKLEVWK